MGYTLFNSPPPGASRGGGGSEVVFPVCYLTRSISTPGEG